jgi:hypothetical protein
MVTPPVGKATVVSERVGGGREYPKQPKPEAMVDPSFTPAAKIPISMRVNGGIGRQ